jgi:hypothetical protein
MEQGRRKQSPILLGIDNGTETDGIVAEIIVKQSVDKNPDVESLCRMKNDESKNKVIGIISDIKFNNITIKKRVPIVISRMNSANLPCCGLSFACDMLNSMFDEVI